MARLTFKIVDYDRAGELIYTDKDLVPRVQFLDEENAKIMLMGLAVDNESRQIGKDGQFEETIGGTVAYIQEMKQELVRRFQVWLSSRGKVAELNQIHGESIEVDWPNEKR